MQNEVTDIKAFLSGHKPAFLYNHNKDKPWFYEDEEVNMLKKYPSIHGLNVEQARSLTLYFQDDEKRSTFLDRTHDLPMESPKWHGELGLALGYPPKTVEFYVQAMQHRRLKEEKGIGIHFNGIGCLGSIDNIEENIEWLWDQYPPSWFKKDLELSYQSKWYMLPYRNYEELNKIHIDIKKRSSVINI